MDKLSRKLIRCIRNSAGNTSIKFSLRPDFDIYADVPYQQLIARIDDNSDNILSAVDYLVESRLLEYHTLKSRTGLVHVAVSLSHKGMNQHEFNRDKIVLYLSDNWIDLLSLITAVIALIRTF